MSDKIKITLPDSSTMSVEKGISASDVVGKISDGLKKNTMAVKVNGTLFDFATICSKFSKRTSIFNHRLS